jgi:hypothetical protein
MLWLQVVLILLVGGCVSINFSIVSCRDFHGVIEKSFLKPIMFTVLFLRLRDLQIPSWYLPSVFTWLIPT